MPDYEATVVPDQDWSVDGTAKVTPHPPCPVTETVTLPLEHRSVGQVSITRDRYPNGMVFLPMEGYPTGATAVLPLRTSTEDTISDEVDQDWPEGGVLMFLES